MLKLSTAGLGLDTAGQYLDGTSPGNPLYAALSPIIAERQDINVVK